MDVDAARAPQEDAQPGGPRAGFLQPLDFALADEGFKLVAFVENDFSIGRAGGERLIDELRGERGAEVLVCSKCLDHERPGPADDHAVELDGGHADTDRHALAFLAAGADAFIEPQVVAHHRDILQRLGAVADQRSVLYRRGDLAIFDQVGLAGGEDEFAVGDVHLAAAEVHRVEAALHRAQDVLRRILTGQHVGVGHARHRDSLIAFAAAVAGLRNAHQPRREFVAHVALENAVFDENRFLRGRSFIIDVERAAAVGHATVVDDRDF